VQAFREPTGKFLEPMDRAAWMIGVHLEEIVAYWTRRLTTAFIEGFNSLFPAMKRMACRHRTVGFMTAMLYFAPGKFTLP
jgi:hypothetical protein